jgi:hypothetical protein
VDQELVLYCDVIISFSALFLLGFLALSCHLSYMVATACICDMRAIWKCI